MNGPRVVSLRTYFGKSIHRFSKHESSWHPSLPTSPDGVVRRNRANLCGCKMLGNYSFHRRLEAYPPDPSLQAISANTHRSRRIHEPILVRIIDSRSNHFGTGNIRVPIVHSIQKLRTVSSLSYVIVERPLLEPNRGRSRHDSAVSHNLARYRQTFTWLGPHAPSSRECGGPRGQR